MVVAVHFLTYRCQIYKPGSNDRVIANSQKKQQKPHFIDEISEDQASHTDKVEHSHGMLLLCCVQ